MVLHLTSDLNLALSLKSQLNCPHIHFIIEQDCDAFTTSLVWMEVLTRGSEACRREGACIVSYSDFSRGQGTLNGEDVAFFHQLQKQLDEKMEGIKVIRNGHLDS